MAMNFNEWLSEVNSPYESSSVDDFTQLTADSPQWSADPAMQTDFTQFLSDTASTTPQWSADPSTETDFTKFLSDPQSSLWTEDQASEGWNPLGGVTDTIKQGASTLNSFMLNLFGGDQKAVSSLYSAAIVAGANAILQGSQNDDYIKFKNDDREDQQAHEKELVSDKYKREDEARIRKNAIPTRAGQFQYQPDATRNYQVPGFANTKRYGILGGK